MRKQACYNREIFIHKLLSFTKNDWTLIFQFHSRSITLVKLTNFQRKKIVRCKKRTTSLNQLNRINVNSVISTNYLKFSDLAWWSSVYNNFNYSCYGGKWCVIHVHSPQWVSMYSRNFGYDIIARPSVCPHLGVSRLKMSHVVTTIMDKSLGSHLHLWGFLHNHTCPTPPPDPQTRLDACIQNFSRVSTLHRHVIK